MVASTETSRANTKTGRVQHYIKVSELLLVGLPSTHPHDPAPKAAPRERQPWPPSRWSASSNLATSA
eukprot:5447717-Pleurochrysis_carterae.AAC.1